MFIKENQKNEETVRHEWGHYVKETILGFMTYAVLVALPSFVYYSVGDYDKYDEQTDDRMYYSKIRERTADYFGGVDRNGNYDLFWRWSNFVPW